MTHYDAERVRTVRDAGVAEIRSSMIDLRSLLTVLRRRRWWIVLPVLFLMILALLYISLVPPKYTATAQLLVKGDSGPVVNLTKEEPLVVEDESSVLDQIRVLQSRELAERVVKTLELYRNPEFNVDLVPKNVLQLAAERVVSTLLSVLPWGSQDKLPSEVEEVIKREKVASAFLRNLSVERFDKSRVISVSFTSKNPVTAKDMANALAVEYLALRTNKGFESARTAGAWLDERARKLRERVEKDEKAIQEYRQRNGLLEGERVTLIAEQISRLNAALVDASIERKKAQADLAQVKRLLGPSADVTSASQVMDSDVYKALRQETVALEQQEAELGRELGPVHPQLQQLRARKARLLEDIGEEVRKVVRSLENQAAAASAREEALDRDLRSLKEQLAAANFKSADLAALEREAEASRMLLAKVMTGSMEKAAEQDPGAQAAGADILSLAATPIDPSHPQKFLVLFLTFFGSALLGVLLALAIDMMDVTYRTAEQIERDTRAPLLSYIPAMSRSETDGDVATFGLRNPSSPFAEAIRTVLARLVMNNASRPAKVVALVSSDPKEGKSTLALAIARLQSLAGCRVLLIDADIRRSRIAQFLRVNNRPGLLDILSGAIELPHAIQVERQSGLHVVVSGDYRQHVNYSDFLVSDASRLRVMLDSVRDQYDVIFIDTPPMLALVDAQILATVVDTSLLIVAWGRTPKKTVDATVNIIRSARAHVSGIILNMVDRRKIGGYQTWEAGYFDRRYGPYYDFGGRAGAASSFPKMAAAAGSCALLLHRSATAAASRAGEVIGGAGRFVGKGLVLRLPPDSRCAGGGRASSTTYAHVASGRSLPALLTPLMAAIVASMLIAHFLLSGTATHNDGDKAASMPSSQDVAAALPRPGSPDLSPSPLQGGAATPPGPSPMPPPLVEESTGQLPRPVPRPKNAH
jgi:succinoglycan biosynthesis transport protein ExoP